MRSGSGRKQLYADAWRTLPHAYAHSAAAKCRGATALGLRSQAAWRGGGPVTYCALDEMEVTKKVHGWREIFRTCGVCAGPCLGHGEHRRLAEEPPRSAGARPLPGLCVVHSATAVQCTVQRLVEHPSRSYACCDESSERETPKTHVEVTCASHVSLLHCKPSRVPVPTP